MEYGVRPFWCSLYCHSFSWTLEVWYGVSEALSLASSPDSFPLSACGSLLSEGYLKESQKLIILHTKYSPLTADSRSTTLSLYLTSLQSCLPFLTVFKSLLCWFPLFSLSFLLVLSLEEEWLQAMLVFRLMFPFNCAPSKAVAWLPQRIWWTQLLDSHKPSQCKKWTGQ